MDLTNIILRPLHTEKTYALQQEEIKKYVFEVNKKANKFEIKLAFEAIFGIQPEKVNIVTRKPTAIRTGTRNPGMSKFQKIAYITLPKGAEITLDEDEKKEAEKTPKKERVGTLKKVNKEPKETQEAKPEVKQAKPKTEQKPKKEIVEEPVDEETLKREKQSLVAVEEDKNSNKKEETAIIMISAKQKYCDLLFDKHNEKNILFYKVTPANKVERVIVYSTAPSVKKVVGEFDLDKVEILNLKDAWKKFGNNSCMTKEEFDEYYQGSENAHVLIAKKSYRYREKKPLDHYKMNKGPSGFQYLK